MKYLISIILLPFLTACNSASENSKILLPNEILNGKISHIYEIQCECPKLDNIYNLKRGYCATLDSTLYIINRQGHGINHIYFDSELSQYRNYKYTYENNKLKSLMAFDSDSNRIHNYQVVKYQSDNLPYLVEDIYQNRTLSKEKIFYNEKDLVTKSIEYYKDFITTEIKKDEKGLKTKHTEFHTDWTKKRIIVNEYNDNNQLKKSIHTDFTFGEPLDKTSYFEYLSYDKKENWTSRSETNGTSKIYMTYRKYEYYE